MDEIIIEKVVVQYSTKWIVFEKRQKIADDITGTPERNGSLKRLLECVIRLVPWKDIMYLFISYFLCFTNI